VSIFRYPKSLHRRTENPPVFGDYKKYKPYLKREFFDVCIYCRTPDKLKGSDNYGVEHYKPKKQFPYLKTDYTNLLYACNTCNRRKRDTWPSASEIAMGRFILNPCLHRMSEHLRLMPNGEIDVRTSAGEVLVDLLILNEDSLIEFRLNCLNLLKAAEYTKSRLSKTIAQLNQKISTLSDPNKIKKIKNKVSYQNRLLSEVENQIAFLSG
jgi:hypothetical protein